MEKKRKVIQIYSIIVCIVAIITFIISLSILVSSIIDLGNPIYSGYSKLDLSSFQNYKMEVMKSVDKEQAYIPDDQTIKEMYEAARNDKINKVLHNSKSNIIVTSILILFCIILFFTHWRMIKKYNSDIE
ncbi:MAG: hypothetical protein KAG64_00740 [Bacteroidales bacterium]|nr:hypothetical protein [Bacteroidales bacterium]